MYRVSVIIPSYNYAHFLGEAIQSVLYQTFTDFELIVVDDGSTDNTKEVVSSFEDPRIEYIYQENRGLPAAENTGIKAARGKYVAILGADDIWLPEKLELQVKCLESSPQAGLVYSDFYYYDSATGTNLRTWLQGRDFLPPRGKVLEQLIRNSCSPLPSTIMVRKQVFDKVGMFDEKLKMVEDSDILFRIASYFEFEILAIPLVKYRLHAAQMNNQLEFHHWRLVFWNRVVQSSLINDELRGVVSRKLARLHCEYGLALICRGKLRKGMQEILGSVKMSPSIFLRRAASLLGKKIKRTSAAIAAGLNFRLFLIQ